VNERMPTGHNLQLDRVPLLGCVYERGDRQTSAKRRRWPMPCRAQMKAPDANAPQQMAKLRRVRVMG
jgi:hypothetical protein